jgi:MurNAc alpha-1-phosphate uridylyltransferase
MKIDTILIFAAGFGTRMRELTSSTPKPLINVLGKPILYYVLDSIVSHGFKRIFINSHYLHEQIEDAVKYYVSNNINCPKITILHEPEILDTGGTVKHNLDLFDSEYIFTHNSDIILKSDTDFLLKWKVGGIQRLWIFFFYFTRPKKQLDILVTVTFILMNMGFLGPIDYLVTLCLICTREWLY